MPDLGSTVAVPIWIFAVPFAALTLLGAGLVVAMLVTEYRDHGAGAFFRLSFRLVSAPIAGWGLAMLILFAIQGVTHA